MWEDTSVKLPEDGPDRFSDVLTGQKHTSTDGLIPASILFNVLPVAVLVAKP